MIWSSWSEFFDMGGYGFYVWGSYLVTVACVIGEVVLISQRRRTLVKTYGLIHDLNSEEISDPKTSPEAGKLSEVEESTEISDSNSNKEEKKNETTS